MTEPLPANAYTVTATPAADIILAVPYTCHKCGAHLGQYVYAHGRVCVDQGRGPLHSISGWCNNPECGKHYYYEAKFMTLAQVVEMRAKIEEGE